MRKYSLGRILKIVCILLVAVSTMIIVASIFVTSPDRQSGYSAPQGRAEERASTNKPPETFWERAESDPVAAFTGVLAVFTLALVVVSAIQIYFLTLADKNSRAAAEAAVESNKLSRELFIAEKRPWIKVDVSVPQFAQYRNDGWITVKLSLVLHNIGDSPALRVTHGWLELYLGGTEINLPEFFDKIRDEIDPRMNYMGRIISLKIIYLSSVLLIFLRHK